MAQRPDLTACAVVAALFAAGCATDLIRAGDGPNPRFRHSKLGYTIAQPESARAGRWARFEVEGADLSFRSAGGDSGAFMSLLSQCRGGTSQPDTQARHLLIGLDDRHFVDAGPTEVDGAPAWTQTVDAQMERRAVRVLTVSALRGGCLYDWLLVSSEKSPEIERAFREWWRSFRFAGSPTSDSGVAAPLARTPPAAGSQP